MNLRFTNTYGQIMDKWILSMMSMKITNEWTSKGGSLMCIYSLLILLSWTTDVD